MIPDKSPTFNSMIDALQNIWHNGEGSSAKVKNVESIECITCKKIYSFNDE